MNKKSSATSLPRGEKIKNLLVSKCMMWLILCLSVLFAGCSPSTADITETVKQLMIQKAKEQGSEMKISELTLVKKSDKEYTGLAKCTIDGVEIECDVEAVYDGTNVIASWEPTAEYQQKSLDDAINEYREEVEKAQNEFDNSIDEAVEDVDDDYDE